LTEEDIIKIYQKALDIILWLEENSNQTEEEISQRNKNKLQILENLMQIDQGNQKKYKTQMEQIQQIKKEK